MDIKGVNRLRAVGAGTTELKGNREGSAERDAQGNMGYQKRETPTQLTSDQEEEALQSLRESEGFAEAGLSAEFVRESGSSPHILVLNAAGDVIRRVPYEQIVSLYVQRNAKQNGGRILNRVA